TPCHLDLALSRQTAETNTNRVDWRNGDPKVCSRSRPSFVSTQRRHERAYLANCLVRRRGSQDRASPTAAVFVHRQKYKIIQRPAVHRGQIRGVNPSARSIVVEAVARIAVYCEVVDHHDGVTPPGCDQFELSSQR